MIVCDTCGSTSWESTETGTETVRLRIHTDADKPWGTEKSLDYEITDSDPWTCENGHDAGDEGDETLSDMRETMSFAT